MGAEQSRTGAVVPGNGAAVPHGMSTLGPNLQKRFAKGIQYNSKFLTHSFVGSNEGTITFYNHKL